MSIILKHTLKSMWAHKGRTLLLLISIALCSFAAMMAFGLSGTIDSAMRSAMNTAFGSADIVVTSDYPLGTEATDGLPESVIAREYTGSTTFTEHIPGSYNIIRQTNYTIVGVDVGIMKQMGMMPEDLELGEMEAAIGERLAAKLGSSVGDLITLYSSKKEPFDFTVKSIQSSMSGMFLFDNHIIVSADSIKKMEGQSDPGVRLIYIDVLDNSRVNEAKEILEQNNPAVMVDVLIGDESMQQFISYMTNMMLAMFAILLLLVLFVTISSSQRVITEKMPVIGTFRSLGISAGLTYTVLLAENALYGLVGSVIGVMLDSVVRPGLVSYVVAPGTADGGTIPVDTGSTSPLLMAAVIIGAMLVECLCPIKEILLAVKTPIRDIIFSNKDSQYRHSRVSTILGIVLAMISVILLFIPDSFIALLVSFIFLAVSIALLFPYVLRFAAGLISKLCGRLNMPIGQLAATEVRERKSTVGSAVLCFAASSIAIVIYLFASSVGETFVHSITDADLIVTVQSDTRRSKISYIEDIDGVTDVEYVYSCIDTVTVNGEPADMQTVVNGVPEGGFRMYDALAEVPGDLGYDEVVLTEVMADKYGLRPGDSVDISFKTQMFMPMTKTLTVRGTGLASYTDSSSRMLVISEKLYKEIFKDFPQTVLARCTSPALAAQTIMNRSAGYIQDAQTKTEYDARNESDSRQIMTAINFLILFAAGMTFMGVAGNQLIGFEGRRRECAVLMSTSMTRRQLAKMFFIESFTAAGISLICAVPAAALLSGLFGKIVKQLMITLPDTDSTGAAVTLGLMLWALFTAVAAFPISRMRRMNIAEQLKYE